ncbi:MAG: GGDEF domain-containing protein [Nanoarchaeota archaeon]
MIDAKSKLKILDPKIRENISKLMREIENNIDYLYELAITDEKTGLYNHKFFKTISEMELDKAKRGLEPLSLFMMDLDNFKKLNDTYGHLVGDDVLKRLAKILKKETRKYDLISRFGGEEFIIILPNTDVKRAKVVCNRLRIKVQNDKIMKKYGTTMSGGLTTYKKGDNIRKMQLRADKAVYLAKKLGKNRVEVIV